MPEHLHIKFQHQEEDAGCLAACAQMVLDHLGIKLSQRNLNRLLGLTPAGIPAPRLMLLERYGVQITFHNGTLDDLIKASKKDLIPIIFVSTGPLPYWNIDTQHALLFVGYDEDNVLLADPAFTDAPQYVSRLALMLAWDEFNNRYALISKPQNDNE